MIICDTALTRVHSLSKVVSYPAPAMYHSRTMKFCWEWFQRSQRYSNVLLSILQSKKCIRFGAKRNGSQSKLRLLLSMWCKEVIYLLWLSFLGVVSGDKQQLPVGVTVKTSEPVCEGTRCGWSALKHGGQGTEGGGAVSAPSACVHSVVCLPTCSHVQGTHTCDLYVK